MQKVQVDLIDPLPVRLQFESNIDELEESLGKYGQFSPIRVRRSKECNGRFQIIFGNRRLLAAKKLGWSEINAEVVDASDSEVLEMAFSENEHRRDFSDYEKALLIKRLQASTGKNYLEISRIIKKSPAYVYQHNSMLDAFSEAPVSREERARVLQALSEKHVRMLLRIPDSEERWNTAKLAVNAHFGVRELERYCSKFHRGKIRGLPMREKEKLEKRITSDFMSFNSGAGHAMLSGMQISKDFILFSMFPPFYNNSYLTNDQTYDAEKGMMHMHLVLQNLTSYKVKILDMRIRSVRDFAYAALRLKHEFSVYGRMFEVCSRATIIFEKIDGEWKMVHEHASSLDPELIINLCRNKSVRPVDK